MEIKIRFNTEKDKTDGSLPAWRVLIEGKEYLAENVRIEAPAWTTHDQIAPNIIKWHITCDGTPDWSADHKICTIK